MPLISALSTFMVFHPEMSGKVRKHQNYLMFSLTGTVHRVDTFFASQERYLARFVDIKIT